MKLLATLFLFFLIFVVGYFSMTVGWGMVVKSWTTIILCTLINLGLMFVMSLVSKIES